MKKITVAQARESARDFVRHVTKPPRQWTVNTAERFTPVGWRLPNDTTDDEFFPITVAHVADVYRRKCVPGEY